MAWVDDHLEDALDSCFDEDMGYDDDEDVEEGQYGVIECPFKYTSNGTIEAMFCRNKCNYGNCDNMTNREAKTKVTEFRAWVNRLPSSRG